MSWLRTAAMLALEKISRYLNLLFIWVAGVCLAAMILVTCANIFLRLVWIPVKGTYELMGYFGAIVTAFSLGYTQMKKAHTRVDILVDSFSAKIQMILNAVNLFVCGIFFVVAGWYISKYANTLWSTGEVTETLRIVYYPFTFGVAAGCFLIALVMLVEIVKLFFEQWGGR
jgi:TRAP-type C4-dicarboxylate transport system permease small subunit